MADPKDVRATLHKRARNWLEATEGKKSWGPFRLSRNEVAALLDSPTAEPDAYAQVDELGHIKGLSSEPEEPWEDHTVRSIYFGAAPPNEGEPVATVEFYQVECIGGTTLAVCLPNIEEHGDPDSVWEAIKEGRFHLVPAPPKTEGPSETPKRD